MSKTVSQGLESLNNADLSKLETKLSVLRKELAKALELADKKAEAVATIADVKKAAEKAGVTVEEFMAALETAKRMGLL